MAPQLTLREREQIAQLRASHFSNQQIAQALGRSPSTISRELRRNACDDGYWPAEAQQHALTRRRERPLRRKMDHPELNQFVRKRLVKAWSPEQIAGRRKLEQTGPSISHETIYRWIRRSPHAAHWQQYLRRGGRRKDLERRGKIPARVEIAGRPAVVAERSRFGDWEGDTIVGRGRRSGLVSLVERKSGYLLLSKTPRLKATPVRRAIQRKAAALPPELKHTLTLDNGKEFAEHQLLAQHTGLAIYFAKPYCAWQRGTNENTNGLVRQYFPKGFDFTYLPHTRLQEIQDLLNHRPRKRLGWKSPQETLFPRPSGAFES